MLFHQQVPFWPERGRSSARWPEYHYEGSGCLPDRHPRMRLGRSGSSYVRHKFQDSPLLLVLSCCFQNGPHLGFQRCVDDNWSIISFRRQPRMPSFILVLGGLRSGLEDVLFKVVVLDKILNLSFKFKTSKGVIIDICENDSIFRYHICWDPIWVCQDI